MKRPYLWGVVTGIAILLLYAQMTKPKESKQPPPKGSGF